MRRRREEDRDLPHGVVRRGIAKYGHIQVRLRERMPTDLRGERVNRLAVGRHAVTGDLPVDRLDARTLGGFLTVLMASVCYEGELLDVCTYDQPGVEAYKSIMRARL